MPNQNIYQSAVAPKDKKRCFNSEPRRLFTDTARNITDDDCAKQHEILQALIADTKRSLANE